LFHSVTIYLYKANGDNTESLQEWIRIIKNLVINSTIDTESSYKNAIKGINKVADKWNRLLQAFSEGISITGFSEKQKDEEYNKAQIILSDDKFADVIYKAEQHPYFCGQIRSALQYAKNCQGEYDINIFNQYWNKISEMFLEKGPKYKKNLLRQALLTYGDYTLAVGAYKTLCVDDPNEATSTPSLKRLFSGDWKNNNTDLDIVKQFLDTINIDSDIEKQLVNIVETFNICETDWRYSFIKYGGSFNRMSSSYLRLRQVNNNGESEWIMVGNKSSNGRNYDVFLEALYQILVQQNIKDLEFKGDPGTYKDRYLAIKEYKIYYKNKKIIVKDEDNRSVFITQTGCPITETVKFINQIN